jgi:hypothetical protein
MLLFLMNVTYDIISTPNLKSSYVTSKYKIFKFNNLFVKNEKLTFHCKLKS